jgi:class 3 adenylate cyclase
MGIATGPVIVGNIGCASVRRMDYTAIGDPVNRASALQKIAERGQILLDQRSADLIGEAFEVRPLGQREMKGIAIEVYELVGTKPKAQAPQGKAAGQPAA